MEPLIINATDDTPEIIFDPQKKVFKISRISVPEDAYEFYSPVIEWVKLYGKNPLDETVLEFNLEYVNSASTKQLIQLLLAFEEINKKSKVKIIWNYESIDEDMLMLGKRFKNLTDIEFDFREI